jgi:hypothetical protein
MEEDMFSRMEKAFNMSKEELTSISAWELMIKATDFHKELTKLIEQQKMPTPVIISILIEEIIRLGVEKDVFLMQFDINRFFDYVNNNFKKKKINIKSKVFKPKIK